MARVKQGMRIDLQAGTIYGPQWTLRGDGTAEFTKVTIRDGQGDININLGENSWKNDNGFNLYSPSTWVNGQKINLYVDSIIAENATINKIEAENAEFHKSLDAAIVKVNKYIQTAGSFNVREITSNKISATSISASRISYDGGNVNERITDTWYRVLRQAGVFA